MDSRAGRTRTGGHHETAEGRLRRTSAIHRSRVTEGGQKTVIYADTSFLFSLYALDSNSALAVSTYQNDARRPLFLTPWQRFELRNVVRLAAHQLKRARPPVQV